MKLVNAVLILTLIIIIQISFVRLFDFFSFAPNLPLVVLFILCYDLSFEKILFLAIFVGLSIDLASSISFGSTLLAFFIACSLSFYLRENVLKGGRLMDLLLNSLITFVVFYCLLAISNIFLKPSIGYASIFNLININLAGEILLDLVFSVFGYYLAGRYSNNKIYGFVQNIKISS